VNVDIFICGLFNDDVTNSDCVASNVTLRPTYVFVVASCM
jgi:hypothetical protein